MSTNQPEATRPDDVPFDREEVRASGYVPFEPQRYLIDLPLRSRDPKTGAFVTRQAKYLPVKDRVRWCRSDFPDATIRTKIMRLDDTIAVFRATVLLPSGGGATGFGHSNASASADYIERAETKAIGRALANCGYGTQFCGDDLAEDEVTGIADAPVPVRTAQVGTSTPQTRPATSAPAASRPVPEDAGWDDLDAEPPRPTARPVTDPQKKAIFAIARGRGIEPESLRTDIALRYRCGLDELSSRQASEYIDVLKSDTPIGAAAHAAAR